LRARRLALSDNHAFRSAFAEEQIIRLILDGTVVRVRLDRKATPIALLVVLGVRELLQDRGFEFAVERGVFASLPAFCTGCLCRARIAAARNGWPITGSPGSTGCSCITSTGRWLGLARRSLLPPPVPWRRAAPRT
jgi:hypothetical protein